MDSLPSLLALGFLGWAVLAGDVVSGSFAVLALAVKVGADRIFVRWPSFALLVTLEIVSLMMLATAALGLADSAGWVAIR